MYRTCIFCSRDLGRNERIEAFPVGNRLAFDGWKGRLWVICPKCQRWNLAPLEERWEAVEEAEKQFRDARTRVQSENIGLARLPDGTRLVRVGEALPGELAAWRYGDRLVRRHREFLWGMAIAVPAGVALAAGAPLITAAGVPFGLVSLGLQAAMHGREYRRRQEVVLGVGQEESPTGRPLLIRRYHVQEARVASAGDALTLTIPDATDPGPLRRKLGARPPEVPLELTGERAERLVGRALVGLNTTGGSRRNVRAALELLADAGSARAFLGTLGGEGITLQRRRSKAPSPDLGFRAVAKSMRGEVLPIRPYRSPWFYSDYPALTRVQSLALEMSLNEDAERRALEGELTELEAAWREAEEIARIADALPDDPPQLGSS